MVFDIQNNEKVKVTILSITYNHEKYIAETLESLIKQKTNFKYKVLIGDDASTDQTANIIREYAEKYPEIITTILRTENVGIHHNLYDLLYQIDSDYIAYCEGDDYFTCPDKLQKQVDFMDKNTDYGMCFHPVKVFYDDNEQPESIYPNTSDPLLFSKETLLKYNFIQTNSVMWRRQNYQNMPNDIMPLDWYLHCYHAKFGKIGFLPQVMSAYRKHDGGVWSKLDEKGMFEKYDLGLIKFYYEVVKLYPDNTYLLDRLIKYQKLAKRYLSVEKNQYIKAKIVEEYPNIYKQVKWRRVFLPFIKKLRKIRKFFKV